MAALLALASVGAPGWAAACAFTACFYQTHIVGQRSNELAASFQGSTQSTRHPGSGDAIQAMREGEFHDLRADRRFRGQFMYLPVWRGSSHSGGYYIFQGVRVDPGEAPQPGIFVSTVAFDGVPGAFQRARPDYLSKIKMEQEASLQQGRDYDAQRAQAWGELFGTFLGVMSGVATANVLSAHGTGLPSAAMSGLSQSSFGLLGQALQGQGSPADALQGVLGLVSAAGGQDPALSQILGTARDTVGIVERLSAAGHSDGKVVALGVAQLLTDMARREHSAAPAPALAPMPAPAIAPAAPAAWASPAPAAVATAAPAVGGMPASSYVPGGSAAAPLPAPAPAAATPSGLGGSAAFGTAPAGGGMPATGYRPR